MFINFTTSISAAALPDFAQVYRFIGRLFDSSARDHLTELKKMDPINIETVSHNVTVTFMSQCCMQFFSPHKTDDGSSILQSLTPDIIMSCIIRFILFSLLCLEFVEGFHVSFHLTSGADVDEQSLSQLDQP